MKKHLAGIFLAFLFCSANAQDAVIADSLYIIQHYYKKEFSVPMRDGIRLFTAVYIPRDSSKKYPLLINRTPYSVAPYGKDSYKSSLLPGIQFVKEGYIFVYQDVRGKMMSEGEFVNMRPHIENKKNKKDIDESTDTWDAIDWLVKNVPHNNGKAGMWGISYPGFYTAAGIINNHPALVAASPQAPIADWWVADDFHHYGALFLPHAFNFLSSFGLPRPAPTTERPPRFRHPTPDGYTFFLEDMGPLKNANNKYYKNQVAFWNEIVEHPDYDAFWQEKNLLPHLKNIKTAVMTVGGWYDAEDLYGALKIYRAIEKNNPGIHNMLVMGPWRHGGWSRGGGSSLGNVFFGDAPAPSLFYKENMELVFFNYYLKSKGEMKLPEAYVFETGINQWRTFSAWPPPNTEQQKLYFGDKQKLSFTPIVAGSKLYDEFISDPSKPVPFTEATTTNMTTEYMTDDQRFAGRRTDVLVYQTDTLMEDITLAGPVLANLLVSTSGTDADWVVKIIDVYPDYHPNYPHNPSHIKMAGYQQMVRSEIFRGRYRNSFEKPEPFVPNQPTTVKIELQDILHTFKKGHRIMVQVQSTWFPLTDRNPQKFVPNIYKANEEDFIKATHRVYHSGENSTYIQVGVLKK